MSQVSHGTYFEDFEVGDVHIHQRARTVTHHDNYAITHLSMNTAQAHFDLLYSKQMMDGRFPERIVAGPCTLGIVVGLTSQDMSENAYMDLGLTAIRLPNPVFAGDTLRAESEVLELIDDHSESGILRYRFVARNQDSKAVAEGIRVVRLKKKGAWAVRDAALFNAP